MPPSAWIALASLAAVMLVQTSVVAFALGRLVQRVATVEKASEDRSELSDKVTRLTVEMEHANNTLNKLVNNSENVNRQLGNIAMGRVGQAREMGA